jgi:multimeric flavodoxin WrbA
LKIGYYSYKNAHEDDDFLPLIQRLLYHDTWVIATPLYWYSMSAQAKTLLTLLDRLTDLITLHKDQGRLLRGRGMAVLCSGTDPTLPHGFEEPFSLTCAYLEMRFLGTHYTQFQGLYPAKPHAGQQAEAFRRGLARGDASQETPPK